jgi:hypothetical protein
VGEVGRASGVAAPAADDQPTIEAATACYLADVVGGQVGGQVGGLAFPSGAPVADDGAVVGDDAGAAASFSGVVVEVGAACCLGSVVVALAVVTAGLAAYCLAASEAGADQWAAHRLRLRMAALVLTACSHGGQRSPQVMGFLQPRHSPGLRLAPRGAV